MRIRLIHSAYGITYWLAEIRLAHTPRRLSAQGETFYEALSSCLEKYQKFYQS